MSKVMITESYLEDIADAIRAKSGTQDTYKPAEMADAIESISGGGITPTGTINITQNGTTDVTNYASANVNVPNPSTGTKQISITQNGTVTEDVTQYASAEIIASVPNSYSAGDEGKVVSNGALVAQTAHADVTPTTSDQTIDTTLNNSLKVKGDADLVAGNIKKDVEIFGVTGSYEGGGGASNEDAILDGSLSGAYSNSTVTSLRQQALSNNNNLTSVSFPAVTSIGNNALYNCQNIESISLPLLANANVQYALAGIKKTPTISLPSLTSAIGNFFFNGSTLLATADLGAVTSLGGQAFVGTAISTLILRRTSVCSLSNTNCFNNTPFASGGTGGILYVPNDLISSYQSASNWSTILGYANNQIKKIEGTIYETQYADGTLIPTS